MFIYLEVCPNALEQGRFCVAYAHLRRTSLAYNSYTGMFPVGDTSSGTLIAVYVCVCVCVSLSADISLNCAKNDSTDYPEILWVCWV